MTAKLRALVTVLATAVLAIYLLGSVVPRAHARPAHKQALADYFGPYLAKHLNSCKTCHVAEKPTDDDYAHNPFGERLVVIKSELRKAEKKADFASRLDAIMEEDSDGDGVSNLLELLSGHNPGDAKDKPTDAEIAQTKKMLPAFTKFRSSYPWRPFETVKRPAVPK